MIKNIFIVFSLLLLSNSIIGQGVEWRTWEEINTIMQTNPRKIIVSFQKDGCPWCDQLETETTNRGEIAGYINTHFYAVKLDVFSSKVIVINQKTYKAGEQGVHDLARVLSRNQISFPMTVFVDENFHVIQPIPGIQSEEKLKDILIYFGESYYLEMPWKRYKALQINNNVGPDHTHYTGH